MGAGIDPEIAGRDACRMEHAISKECFGKLMQALKDPQETPENSTDHAM